MKLGKFVVSAVLFFGTMASVFAGNIRGREDTLDCAPTLNLAQSETGQQVRGENIVCHPKGGAQVIAVGEYKFFVLTQKRKDGSIIPNVPADGVVTSMGKITSTNYAIEPDEIGLWIIPVEATGGPVMSTWNETLDLGYQPYGQGRVTAFAMDSSAFVLDKSVRFPKAIVANIRYNQSGVNGSYKIVVEGNFPKGKYVITIPVILIPRESVAAR